MIVADERVAHFVSEIIGVGLCPPYTCMGIERDGGIMAGVVFNCFEGADVHVTIGGAGWTRRFIEAVGEYVYQHLACERMTIVTEQDDVAGYALRLGGKIEGCLRNHFGSGRDAMIVGILRDEWPYAISEADQRG